MLEKLEIHHHHHHHLFLASQYFSISFHFIFLPIIHFFWLIDKTYTHTDITYTAKKKSQHHHHQWIGRQRKQKKKNKISSLECHTHTNIHILTVYHTTTTYGVLVSFLFSCYLFVFRSLFFINDEACFYTNKATNNRQANKHTRIEIVFFSKKKKILITWSFEFNQNPPIRIMFGLWPVSFFCCLLLVFSSLSLSLHTSVCVCFSLSLFWLYFPIAYTTALLSLSPITLYELNYIGTASYFRYTNKQTTMIVQVQYSHPSIQSVSLFVAFIRCGLDFIFGFWFFFSGLQINFCRKFFWLLIFLLLLRYTRCKLFKILLLCVCVCFTVFVWFLLLFFSSSMWVRAAFFFAFWLSLYLYPLFVLLLLLLLSSFVDVVVVVLCFWWSSPPYSSNVFFVCVFQKKTTKFCLILVCFFISFFGLSSESIDNHQQH